MNGFKTLEKKYGITVVSEGFHWNDFVGKRIETFKMYSADGCPWEKGMTRKAVKAECEKWASQLLSIKNNTKQNNPERGLFF